MLRLGLLINPLAGVGGPAALKGSDGMADAARDLGSEPLAEQRALATLSELADRRAQITLLTWGGAMGERAARAAGFDPQVLGGAERTVTTAEDTRRAALALLEAGCDLLLFAGGDGTARDLVDALGTSRQPVLGIPAGVKMHSGVHAVNPGAAARVVSAMLDGALVGFGPAEVRDIDEQGYREGRVHSRYFGELQVPAEPRWVQHTKIGGRESEPLVLEEIAAWIVELMEASGDASWWVGPGSTTAAVMEKLGLANTLLGVDVVRSGALVRSDATARELEGELDGDEARGAATWVLVTLIGGQGHVFGRGNQQFAAPLLRRVGLEHVRIIATRSKLAALQGRPLQLDTGDAALDAAFSGHVPVITGYEDEVLYPLGEVVGS